MTWARCEDGRVVNLGSGALVVLGSELAAQKNRPSGDRTLLAAMAAAGDAWPNAVMLREGSDWYVFRQVADEEDGRRIRDALVRHLVAGGLVDSEVVAADANQCQDILRERHDTYLAHRCILDVGHSGDHDRGP